MLMPSNLDEAAEPMSLAAADSSLASPLAEVAPQAAPQPIAAAVADTASVMPTATATPVAAAPTPVATLALPAKPLGTLAPSTTAATVPMLGALLLVVGLILALGKLVKRVQASRSGQGAALSIKGGVQIGAKERVVWMQAGDTHLLLGVSPGRVQTLHVFDVAPDFHAAAANEPSPAALETPAAKDFSERLKTLLANARAKGIEPAVSAAPPATATTKPPEPMLAATSKPLFSFRA